LGHGERVNDKSRLFNSLKHRIKENKEERIIEKERRRNLEMND
jgi:hypothetical protein